MTATKARTRHARQTHSERHKGRRPKANNDTNKANKVEAAKPPAAHAAPPEDGTGTGGKPSGTDPKEAGAPAPAVAAAGESA
jgi:hypothetical protein